MQAHAEVLGKTPAGAQAVNLPLLFVTPESLAAAFMHRSPGNVPVTACWRASPIATKCALYRYFYVCPKEGE